MALNIKGGSLVVEQKLTQEIEKQALKTKQNFHEYAMTLNEIKHETESFCNTVTDKIRHVEQDSVNLKSKMKKVDNRANKA